MDVGEQFQTTNDTRNLEHSMWRLLREAAIFVQQILFRLAKRRRQRPNIRVVCLSDTHLQTVVIPPGDVLIHAGDLSQSGHPDEIQQAISWLSSQPHKYKIAIAGNADLFLDKSVSRVPQGDHSRHGIDDGLDWGEIRYLNRSTTTIEFENHEGSRSLTIYGDPNVPRCGPDGQEGFQYDTDVDHWRDSIPSGTDRDAHRCFVRSNGDAHFYTYLGTYIPPPAANWYFGGAQLLAVSY
ncbi:calcineurin-like phosphoesterase [Purpureocillium lavendulum]|uniref:Calcineurin-like phosphoesterase n=1 Tax=Purpureocillium lavendulum TaxID=1247861 RepID=A0AB34FIC0_9HYPO|nr:calcineurin-like phosphoesterase [Purpureocillium lavendulum]